MSSSVTPLVLTLARIQQQGVIYIYSVFLIFGLIGCCFNILLLSSRRQFRIVTCFRYIMGASIIMVISLSIGIGTSLYLLNPVLAASLSTTFFRIRTYILQSSAIMYRWFLLAASFDRYAISSSSQQLRNFGNMHTARRVIFSIIFIWLVLPIYNFIFNTTVLQNTPSNIYFIGVLLFHSIFSAVAGCILPGMLMIIFAFLIQHNLVVKRTRRQIIVTQQIDVLRQERRRDRQVFLILIVQTVMLVITVLPLMVNLFYNAITLNIKDKSTERLAIERFCWFITEAFTYLLPVLSFYLYTMTSSMFRNEFVTIIRSLSRCGCFRINTRIQPTTNATEHQTAAER